MLIDLIKEYALIIKLDIRSLLYKRPPQADQWLDGNKNPILLLPGLSESYFFLETIADRLHKLGYPIHAPKGFNPYMRIHALAGFFADYIRSNNLTNIVCISHSKGGLVAKYLMDTFPDMNKRTRLSISLATPYGGSLLAYLKLGSAFELIPGSAFINAGLLLTKNNHKIHVLYPRFDNHVLPNKHLLLRGGQNTIINVVGHTRILIAEETFETIKKILKA